MRRIKIHTHGRTHDAHLLHASHLIRHTIVEAFLTSLIEDAAGHITFHRQFPTITTMIKEREIKVKIANNCNGSVKNSVIEKVKDESKP